MFSSTQWLAFSFCTVYWTCLLRDSHRQWRQHSPERKGSALLSRGSEVINLVFSDFGTLLQLWPCRHIADESEDCWGSDCHPSRMAYAFPSSTFCVTHKQNVWCLWARLSAPWHQWQSVSEVEYRSRQRAPKGKAGVLLLSEIWFDLHFFSQSLYFDRIFNCCQYFLHIVNYILKKDRLAGSLNKILGCIFKFSYSFLTFWKVSLCPLLHSLLLSWKSFVVSITTLCCPCS